MTVEKTHTKETIEELTVKNNTLEKEIKVTNDAVTTMQNEKNITNEKHLKATAQLEKHQKSEREHKRKLSDAVNDSDTP